MDEGSNFSTSLPAFVTGSFLVVATVVGVYGCVIVTSVCVSPAADEEFLFYFIELLRFFLSCLFILSRIHLLMVVVVCVCACLCVCICVHACVCTCVYALLVHESHGEHTIWQLCGVSALIQLLHGFKDQTGHQAFRENAFTQWAISPTPSV